MEGIKIPNKCFAFVDGSYNIKEKIYGGACILFDQFGNRHELMDSGNNISLAKMRNVAGEILGARLAIEKAVELGMKKLVIFYDYDGVGNWITGKWKPKKKVTKDYVSFVLSIMKKGLKLYFRKVKGHSGIHLNEEVDQLAKKAAGVIK